uniref:Aminopeptidase n=1 Tax=Anopheles christyi TaxID=43041 RepID=A0A182K989_9DIPT
MGTVVQIVILTLGLASLQHLSVSCTPLHTKLNAEDDLLNAEDESRAQLEEYRLNDDVWPTHYDIEIKPYFEPEPEKVAFTFDASTTITVTALKDNVKQIKLHKARLNITDWRVMRKSNSMLVGKVSDAYNEETHIWTLNLNETLLKNVEYYIVFNYVGLMEEDMGGFYRSYFKVNGKQVWLGSTQFEQTEARRAFPCFDEPRYKTTFALKLNYRHDEYQVYSNTPILNSVPIRNNRTLATFGITPKMSTYLLAFIVAPYELSTNDVIGVLARPEALNQTAYSVQEGLKLLKALGDWVDYPFNNVTEISRMYMAAVPDFAAGAMENWGLITYRESSLLYVQEDATSMQQQRIASIISHELAHQWFGNLVTCEWWDVTWLNEGFATYFEYFGTALVEPLWELDSQFVVEKLQTAMQTDGSLSTHPMTHTVYTQAQAAAMFDAISYNKGGVVLRMLEHYLTNDVFKTAVREYVKDRQFETARPENLFAVLDKHNANASAFMKPWTTQPGFPLVTVTSNENGVLLTQKRFIANGTDAEEKLLWPLPITFATKEGEFENTKPIIIASETYNITLSNVSDAPYFILNNQQVGYYRVNYDEVLWQKIGAALRSRGFGGIHVLNRAQIVDDLFNLARADLLGYGKVLDLLSYLKQETEYAPWLAAVNGLVTLAPRIHPEDDKLFTVGGAICEGQYLMDIFSSVYDYVQFQAPTQYDRRVHTYLRKVVLDWTCRYGHDGCSKSAVSAFERFHTIPTVKVHPDLRQVVYCEGVRKGSSKQFDFILNIFLTTNVATEQLLALQGMSCATEEEIVHKFMDLISSTNVRSQDKATALAMLLNNQHALAPATSYLVQNSARWAEAHGDYRFVATALGGILVRVNDVAIRTTIEEFAETNKDVLGHESYELIVTGLIQFENNQNFTMNHRDEIRGFLNEKAGSGAPMTVIYNVVLALMTLAENLALAVLVTCACAYVSTASPLDPDRYFLVEAEPRAQPEDYRLNDD